MSEKAFLKIFPGLLPPEARELDEPATMVRIGDAYRRRTLKEWRSLPLWYPETIYPTAIMVA